MLLERFGLYGCERSGKIRPLKKERFFGVLFNSPLFLGKWCGVVIYFFYTKK